MANNIYSNCLHCSKPFIILSNHTYKKYCNLSCSTSHRNKIAIADKLDNYLKNPNHCCQCNGTLPYKMKHNKFCSRSCAAIFTNSKKDWSKNKKTGPSKGSKIDKPKTQLFYTKIKQCVVCNKFHPKSGKTCSTICQKSLLSGITKKRIHNGWNPNSNRGRQKRSYLEKSFESWLKENFPEINFITEHPFKRLDSIKTYFADFYFPKLSLIIELDGTQHNNTKEYDQHRDNYISHTYQVHILRVTHKEYKNKSKLELIKKLLEPGSGVKPDTSDWKSDM